jgi:serine/threonine protein kinase
MCKHGPLSIGFDLEYCSRGNADQLNVVLPLVKLEIVSRLHLLLDIAETLSDLHALFLCHTDFKPQNILLTVNLSGKIEAKISDFGGIEAIGKPITQCNFLFSDYETRK